MDKKEIEIEILKLQIKRNWPFWECYKLAIDSNIIKLQTLLLNK